MYGIFIIGTAGSGKSLLTASLFSWLTEKKKDVTIVNLDPGVLKLPYNPDIDIRNYISIADLMDKYELGPNGALLIASDLFVDKIIDFNKEIEAQNSEYLLIDTPGQMELFAFRVSGPLIARELNIDQKMVLYLYDAPFCSSPFNYVSTIFLSAAVFLRFMLPQLNILAKSDLVNKEKVREILDWSSRPESIQPVLNLQPELSMYLLAKDLFKAISRLRLDFSLIPCSAKYLDNFVNLHAAITRIFTRGEEE